MPKVPTNKLNFIITSGLILVVLCVSWQWVVAAAPTTNPTDLSKEIKELNSAIDAKKKELDKIKSQQAAYRKEVEKKQAEAASLKNQLSIVDNRMASAQLNLDQVKVDIETTNLEIQRTNLEISESDKSINENKERLSSAIKLLSQEGDRSQLEILLLNSYLTEYISQVKYLEDINGKISGGLNELKEAKVSLVDSKTKLDGNKEKLRTLRQQLEQEQVSLASEKDTKIYILDQTQSSEVEYQKLLQSAKREQDSAASDIFSLEKSVRDRINKQGPGTKTQLKYDGFIWPVPSRRVTALFHDPTYPFNYLFLHPAIDIGTPQGTPIKAAASGYVGRAKDGGMGYSYIMLVHADGLATVYGHVSRMYVKEDDFVQQGQIIAASGAMPGTPGAGPLTTGPHLHLEVRFNGVPVNPLDYMK